MPPSEHATAASVPQTAAQAIIAGLIRHGITAGFGIPSIHNVALYEALRREPGFQHWIVRHEQAAGFAADGYFRCTGNAAAVFASTGPGNLFTTTPLLESLQTSTPVLVIGTNVASPLLDKALGALHETPQQIEILRPLTRLAVRLTNPAVIPALFEEIADVLHGSHPGPVFLEIPHDLLHAPYASAGLGEKQVEEQSADQNHVAAAVDVLRTSRKPAMIVGSSVPSQDISPVLALAEALHAPVFTTTTGKGIIADDHPLCMGSISRGGLVQQVLAESDVVISLGAKLTEFDTGQFQLQLPAAHIQIARDRRALGGRFPGAIMLAGGIGEIAQKLASAAGSRRSWCSLEELRARERAALEGLHQDAYAALMQLRGLLARDDVVVNDQSILNYWASAFFPVLSPRSFLYPSGSGTLGYGLPAAIGAACATGRSGKARRVVCISGDGGFQYTAHELATVAQYGLPVKILLVNDNSYGVIGFLQRIMFGNEHEVALKNPDFVRVAEAYGITAERARTLEELQGKLRGWLNAPGPALLEWQTQLRTPWEAGAIPRPGTIPMKKS